MVGGLIASDPELTLRALAGRAIAREPVWLDAWQRADGAAASAISATLANEVSEPRVVTALAASLPADATLVVSSSMPVRDVETFWPVRDDGPRVLSNRGANGIDGVVSTAFGVAAGSPGPVVALLGDVALAHDIGGLIAARRLGLAVTLVVLNNGGGGIFDFLPVSTQSDLYEQHVATPTGLELADVARTFGLTYETVEEASGFGDVLSRATRSGQSSILEVRTDRAENVVVHRRVWSAVRDAVAAVAERNPA